MRTKQNILFHMCIWWINAVVALTPFGVVHAQTLSSPNYQIENGDIDFGGETSTSTNYQSLDTLNDSADSVGTSTNYKLFPGQVLPWFPSTPGAPTFTNTGGNLYNALDFVVNTGSNSSDTNFALAISDDNFATTYYVQTNLTIATSTTVWQTYTQWGGASGGRITGLTSNTSYKLKVKARYGPDSETPFSTTTTASTINPTLTLSVTGVANSTSVGGATTNIDSTATTVPFSSVSAAGGAKIGAQTISVTTNAVSGYTVTLQQDGNMRKTNGTTIPAVPFDNSSPGSWPTSINQGYFGYHTTDSTLCTGTSSRFTASDTFAAASTTPFEVACNTGPASSDQTSIVFKVEIGSLQPTGDYRNSISYIVTAQY